jgi:hypothetical protein
MICMPDVTSQDSLSISSAHLERFCDYCSVTDPTSHNLDPMPGFLEGSDPGFLMNPDPDPKENIQDLKHEIH